MKDRHTEFWEHCVPPKIRDHPNKTGKYQGPLL
jgi:hypothetical protein